MRGVVSQAMVLVAKDKQVEGKLEFITPPETATPGTIVHVVPDSAPEAVLNPKKKIFETVQPHFGVDPTSGAVLFMGKFPLKIDQENISVPTIRDAIIS